MKSTITLVFAFFAFLPTLLNGQDASEKDRVDFAREVLPILSNKCFLCHGPDTKDEDLVRLDSEAGAIVDLGGYKAVDTENPEKSAVLLRIHDEDDPMPPADSEKQLTDSEKELISKWIRQGGDFAKHWSFVKPVKKLPATIDANAGEKTGSQIIDAYIVEKLHEKEIEFAPETDKANLARRAALILTGLPPEPEILNAFLADSSEQAYSKYIDTLLASPRYGEHQARYWLDAVRYGDTHGLHLDNKRGIYPYRDWVVKAMNDNLPLNTFLKWQLAGDLLPNPTLEQKVATGFVRMNPSTAEGGAIPAEFQAKNNFDRTETFGTVLLGMSLNCARCHTHKYDPIPQQEYYELMAFFNSTAEHSMDGNRYTYGPIEHAPSNQKGWRAWSEIEPKVNEIVSAATELIREKKVELSKDEQKKWNGNLQAKMQMIVDGKGAFAKSTLHSRAIQLKTKFDKVLPLTTTLVAKDLAKPRQTFVLERGEYDKPKGDAVTPDVFSVMGEMPVGAPRNRLGLARWLTSQDNPLVSRVWINRIWQRVFGEGLVRTPEDFGLQGQQPTHPELLDWLAIELQDSGWDLKKTLKMLVMTRTFRQSSAFRKDVEDPENRLFARGPRFRLDAEVLRDVGLWASQLLQDEMGGEGVKPYQPDGMWLAMAHPGSNTKKYVRDKGNLLYRRSLYVYWKRTSPHPMMTLFDAPSRESSCVRRSRTNTPLQSLGLLNETQRIEMSRKFAERLLKSAKDDDSRLSLVFKLIVCREPNAKERATCDSLLQQLKTRYSKSPDDAKALLATGEAPSDESIDAKELAAWSQLVTTVLASDLAILVY